MVVATVALDLSPDRASRAPHERGDPSRRVALTVEPANHVSFFEGELLVHHRITLAGVNPSVWQLTSLFKPSVALTLSIPDA